MPASRTGTTEWLKFRKRYVKELGNREVFCGLCGGQIHLDVKFPNPYSLSLDHIVPVSLGGAEFDEDNIQPAHFKCNAGKRAGRKKQTSAYGSHQYPQVIYPNQTLWLRYDAKHNVYFKHVGYKLSDVWDYLVTFDDNDIVNIER